MVVVHQDAHWALGRCSRHDQWGGDLGEDPGLGGEHRPGNASGFPRPELVNLAQEREVWDPLLELLPPRPHPGEEDEMR